MFFTTAGLLVGVLGLVDLEVHGEQVKRLAELTLTLVLFADASRADRLRPRGRCPRRSARRPRAAVRHGPPADRAALAADPERRIGAARRRHRDGARWKHL